MKGGKRGTKVAVATVLGVILGFVPPRICIIGVAHGQEATQATEDDMVFFYRNPSADRFAQLLVFFDQLARDGKGNAEPPMIGFMAAAFEWHPDYMGCITSVNLSPRMRGVVAIALRLAGQDAKARALTEELQTSGNPVPNLAQFPSTLEAVEPLGPSEFDLLWGASSATADPRYCSKILWHFVEFSNRGDNAPDMVAIASKYGTTADMHWVVAKRGAGKARELLTESSALWALDSNARQHEFVRKVVQDYIRRHAEEPAARALVAMFAG